MRFKFTVFLFLVGVLSTSCGAVEFQPVTITQAKSLPVGSPIELAEVVVTRTFNDRTYIEHPMRYAGIALLGLPSPLPDNTRLRNLRGYIAYTTEGEPMLIFQSAQQAGVFEIKPLGMSIESLFSGMNTTGLLSRVWGRVTGTPPFLFLNDGSGRDIGIVPDASVNLIPGSFTALTGIIGKGGGNLHKDMKPISNTPLPDPFLHRDGTHYYIYGTANYFLQGQKLTPDSLTRVNLSIRYDGFDPPVQIWSMTVYKHTDNSYHAYATLHYGNFRTVIGHFVPSYGTWTDGNPITRWKLQNILVGNMSTGDWKYYESKIIKDTDGTLYLMYTGTINGANHILVRRMINPGTLDPTYPARTILKPEGFRSEDRDPGGMQLVEGPGIHKINGKYVLMYTVGNFQADNYKIGVAYSDTLIPPPGQTYQKVLIPDPANIWGSNKEVEVKYLLQAQRSNWPNYCRSLVAAPGIGTIIEYNGKPMLLFHGYLPTDTTRDPYYRYDWLLPLEINISPKIPMADWIKPVLSVDKIIRVAKPGDVTEY